MFFDFDPFDPEPEKDDIKDLNVKGKGKHAEDNPGFDFEPYEDPKKKREKIDKESAVPAECRKPDNRLKIIKYPTNKHEIKQRPFMEANIIPRHASAVIFNGKQGSGKSNLLVNLMSRPEYYGPDGSRKDRVINSRKPEKEPENEKDKGYFDLVFLFSPTASGGDDLVKFLKIPQKRIFTEFDESKLDKIIQTQKDLIDEKGLLKSPKILIIFEDIQSDSSFMTSKSFLKCFIQCRHLNISTFLLGQSWTRTPRACRLQANSIFFFPSSQSEVELLCEEHCPPGTTKKEFMELINVATKEPYDFLHINNREHYDKRFRHNLHSYLRINRKEDEKK